MAEPRTIFAYDFGISNIGLAIGQEVTNTAQTFITLKAKDGIPSWIELDKLVSEWSPALFVVGNPLNMDGSRSEMQDLSDNFSKKIKNRYGINVEKADERLSTKEALSRIKDEENLSLNADIHSLSAQIILESWFQEKS